MLATSSPKSAPHLSLWAQLPPLLWPVLELVCGWGDDSVRRLSWKQYVAKKPVKRGLKLWCRCDSDTGYCVAFNVYCGSDRDNQQVNLDSGYRVVMDLMPNYLNKHHHVFADNFFTSVYLAEALLQAGTYLCGTTRGTRRDFPNALANAKLRAGESLKWMNEAGVMILK